MICIEKLLERLLFQVSYSLLLSVLEYQTAVMRQDFDTADKVLPSIPKEQRTRVAHFLEKQASVVELCLNVLAFSLFQLSFYWSRKPILVLGQRCEVAYDVFHWKVWKNSFSVPVKKLTFFSLEMQ